MGYLFVVSWDCHNRSIRVCPGPSGSIWVHQGPSRSVHVCPGPSGLGPSRSMGVNWDWTGSELGMNWECIGSELGSSEWSSPRLGSGSARACSFSEGSGSIFWEGHRLGLGLGSMSKPGSLWRTFENEENIPIGHIYLNMDFWWLKFWALLSQTLLSICKT